MKTTRVFLSVQTVPYRLPAGTDPFTYREKRPVRYLASWWTRGTTTELYRSKIVPSQEEAVRLARQWLDRRNKEGSGHPIDARLIDTTDHPERYGYAHAPTEKKSTAQLDTEIAAALSEHGELTRRQQRMSRLRPVEGLWIPADARNELLRFWQAHPALRKGCLGKYGFDPIDEEASYWRFGLAEPGHSDVLRAVRRDGDVFSLPHVKRWEIEELRDT